MSTPDSNLPAASSSSQRTSPGRLLSRLLLLLVILLGILLPAAGRLDWAQGWAFSLAFCAFLLSYGIWVRRNDPGQLAERSTSGRKESVKPWDRMILSIYTVLLLALLVLAGLDAGRFRWAPAPTGLQVAGWIAMVLAGGLVFWTVSVNTFLSRHVRIQDDRGQQTVTRGPYRWIRHPMYLGVIVLMPGIPLALGSIWGLIPGGLIGVLFVVRTALEDRTLQAELPGYREYAQKVRYRLIPGVW
jgi:protein-S-isoprenylcysteine O-methyltransferase Ste14